MALRSDATQGIFFWLSCQTRNGDNGIKMWKRKTWQNILAWCFDRLDGPKWKTTYFSLLFICSERFVIYIMWIKCVGECKHGPKSSAKFKQVSNFDSQQIDTMKSEIQKNNMNAWIVLLVIQVTDTIDNIWYSFSLGCSIVVVKSKETKLIFLFRFGTEEDCVCVIGK